MRREELIRLGDEVMEAWNRGDADGVAARDARDVITADCTLPEPIHGRDAGRELTAAYMHAFPDLHVEVTRSLVDGNTLIQEWTATGTHDGDLMGMSPTHRRVEIRGCGIADIGDDGLTGEFHQYWDQMTMMRQLGAVPETAGATGG